MPRIQEQKAIFGDDTVVVGVSVDSTTALNAWKNTMGIEFSLLSDFYPHGAVAQQYGVLRSEGFPERAIFIIDKEGRIAWARKYELGEHPEAQELLDALEKVEGSRQ